MYANLLPSPIEHQKTKARAGIPMPPALRIHTSSKGLENPGLDDASAARLKKLKLYSRVKKEHKESPYLLPEPKEKHDDPEHNSNGCPLLNQGLSI